MIWFVSQRPRGDTSAKAVAVEIGPPTLADAIDQARATRPEDRIVTSAVPH